MTAQQLTDLDSFLWQLQSKTGSLFSAGRDVIISRAPGRLDVMGGFGDYSGCHVLEWPLHNACFCALQAADDQSIEVQSQEPGLDGQRLVWQGSVAALRAACADIDQARAFLQRDAQTSWIAYVLGAFAILKQAYDVDLDCGLRLFIRSQVPLGKGVSSSAALEVAVMQACARHFNLNIPGEQLAKLCQKVENLIVGAPCGLMDQMTSACGKADHLMQMLCQPGSVEAHIPLPSELAFYGIDSGIRHSVGGSDYAHVRISTYIAYRIIADQRGFPVCYEDGRACIRDERWQNYFGNMSIAEWEAMRADIPEEISGAAFIERYQATHDTVTQVDPAVIYHPRVAADHPVYEEQRVLRFKSVLTQDPQHDDCIELGQLMFAAHASYNANQIGSDGTDHLVRLAQAYGPEQGIYGAKISGGGSGGTVAILAKRSAESLVRSIMQQYESESGRQAELFIGSSPGAMTFGAQTIQL